MIHIIAAACGLGATFALPVLMGLPKTVSQARFAKPVSTGIEKIAKIGSLTLLVTGLGLGALHPFLFTQIWFIASLVIYILVQPIVAGILPERYKRIGKQMAPSVMNAFAIILIILMTLKPF
ncbi:DUF2269 family protein [Guptibacillus sedimenti]|uniref:DUF2269 family protein n=1 Tax=Guptibacillus sedimenti TaxID=3025680 RepID=UPI0023600EC1|nr:DUF2269 family protein [Pseudalkalibacillus sedimenti]